LFSNKTMTSTPAQNSDSRRIERTRNIVHKQNTVMMVKSYRSNTTIPVHIRYVVQPNHFDKMDQQN